MEGFVFDTKIESFGAAFDGKNTGFPDVTISIFRILKQKEHWSTTGVEDCKAIIPMNLCRW